MVEVVLFCADNGSLEIMEFVTREELSIEVVFALEYITTGKSWKEMEISENFAFVVEGVGIFDEAVERRYPMRKIEG